MVPLAKEIRLPAKTVPGLSSAATGSPPSKDTLPQRAPPELLPVLSISDVNDKRTRPFGSLIKPNHQNVDERESGPSAPTMTVGEGQLPHPESLK